MTLKKKYEANLFQPVSVLQSQLLEITAKSLPHGLNENFTISPTIHDEVTLFGLEPAEGRGEEVKEVKERESLTAMMVVVVVVVGGGI